MKLSNKMVKMVMGVMLAAMMAVSLFSVAPEPVYAGGFSLESVGRPGQYLTVRNVDPAKAGGTLRTLKVAGRYSSASNRSTYQNFKASYVVDECFVVEASTEFKNAYNRFHGTSYEHFILKECNDGTFRMVPTNDYMYVWDSAYMRFYWQKTEVGGAIYYTNCRTGHAFKVARCKKWYAK